MNERCTIHQRVSIPDGTPLARGSEVRLPDGSPIPGIQSVTIEANMELKVWVTTITLHAVFGEPILEE